LTSEVGGMVIHFGQGHDHKYAYLILQLIEIPQEFGKTLLDKLRYLQSYMCQEISYVHWFRKLIWIR
jgi:hypothetical protein